MPRDLAIAHAQGQLATLPDRHSGRRQQPRRLRPLCRRTTMSSNDVSVVLVHGAWADGSSWAKVIAPLAASGVKTMAAPLPLTSFADDVATLERAPGPIVLVGHAYAGGVIGAVHSDKVKALVYVAALAPDEGETVADVF